MSELLFFAGLALLVMGKISIGNINAEGPKVRAAGFMLAMPLLVDIVMWTVFNFIFGDGSGTVSGDGALLLLLISICSWIICIGVAYTLIRDEGPFITPPTNNTNQEQNQNESQAQKPTPIIQTQPKPSTTPHRNFPRVMSLQQAASYLNVSEQDVLELIEDGKLTAARINYRYQISRSVLDDFIQDQSN